MSRIITIVVVLAGANLCAAQAEAQRTTPPTLDLTCHGYVEATRGTRAYNCIPEPSQQAQMRTFVPAVGSACDEGQVDEFPPGRIVFQIRCSDTGGSRWSRSGRGRAWFDKPISAVRVRIRSRSTGYSDNFIVWCRNPRTSLVVNELVGTGWGNTGTDGIYRMADCREVAVLTESSVRWSFTQETGTAFTPLRSWTSVTGAGGTLSAEALADLATATEAERTASAITH